MEHIDVIVDDRELKGACVKKLFSLGLNFQAKRLESADFIIDNTIAIERKAMNDFENSIIDGRLFSQAIALKNSFATPMFCIVGNSGQLQRLDSKAVQGAVLSLLLDYRIPVLFLESEEHLAHVISHLSAKQLRKSSQQPHKLVFQKLSQPSNNELLQFIVESMPNIGPVLAQSLLKKFGSLNNLFNSNVEELQEVEGIGKEKAEQLFRLFHAKFGGN